MTTMWYLLWVIGGFIILPIIYFSTRNAYFKVDPAEFVEAPTKFESIYETWWKARTSFIGSITAIYYACYVIASLLVGDMGRIEAAIHLAVWTIAPPLWFSYERYFFFDQVDDSTKVVALKEGQDYASKFWAAILAVILAFQLGEIIKSKPSEASASKQEVQTEAKQHSESTGSDLAIKPPK
ncbi:hypothetical protein [Methylomonas albis]|uniref:DUF1772 domain-containing protein n=1 Tax=Methylomonas albis TaxID=1854563 RepID=A0ABR9CWE0_9GAMM|nr:hypothetical protein [Methylomonas albis]MBD9355190.1 hypothetical protein [Methylomonas albis]